MNFCSFAQKLVLAVVLVIGIVPLRANIGDEISDLRGRYGGAKNVGSGMIFQHDGYSICVFFDGSQSAMEVFTRDGSVPAKTDITQKDVDAILASEAVGKSWNEIQTNSGKKTWLCSDNKLIARLSADDKTGEKTLMIMVNSK